MRPLFPMLLLIACTPEPLFRGNGLLAYRSFPLEGLNGVTVVGPLNAEVTTGSDHPTVELEGDSNLVSWVQRREDGASLVVDATGLLPTLPLTVKVSLTSLRRLSATDGATVSLAGFDGGRLVIEGRREAVMLVTGVNVDTLEVSSSEGASVDVSGATRLLDARSGSRAVLNASSLEARVGLVQAGGASTVLVNARDAVRGEASEDSRVVVTGAARRQAIRTQASPP